MKCRCLSREGSQAGDGCRLMEDGATCCRTTASIGCGQEIGNWWLMISPRKNQQGSCSATSEPESQQEKAERIVSALSGALPGMPTTELMLRSGNQYAR